ncbi:MAG: hypothetical protein WAW06_07725 [bacterium]
MSSRTNAVLAVGLALAILAAGAALCQDRRQPAGKAKPAEPWDAERGAAEYRQTQLELALAKTGSTYMVIDLDRLEVVLKMKGAAVWNARMQVAVPDSAGIGAFGRRFKGDDDDLVRMVASRYLFAAKEKTPDSILAIVGEVVKADPQLLQRDIPERFELAWGWDVVLEVRTDVQGEPRSKFKNFGMGLIEAVRRPFGGERLKIRLAPDDALTLYRAASPGLPTLLVSSF